MRRALLFAAGFLAGLTAAAAVARALIPSIGDEESDEISLVAIANGVELRSRAAAFRGGSVSAWMGGMELDLRGASLAANGARLDLTALMAGIDLRIPPAWRVSVVPRGMNQGLALDLRGQDELPSDAPHLEITALVIGAGVSISNDPGDGADA